MGWKREIVVEIHKGCIFSCQKGKGAAEEILMINNFPVDESSLPANESYWEKGREKSGASLYDEGTIRKGTLDVKR